MDIAPTLSPVDFALIGLYFLVIVVIGFAGAHFAKTKEDYLVAGRRLSFPLFFGCMAALCLGGGSTLGGTQLGYEYGFGGIWLNLSIGLGLIITGFLVTSKLSRLKALSVNEIVEKSYGPTARVFSSVLTLIYTLTLSVTQVISIGTIVHVVFGFGTTISMVVGGGIVIAYTFVGGMWSVTMTDIVQFVVKTIGVLILAPIFCLAAAGGWDGLVSRVPDTFLSVGSMGFNQSLAYVLLYVPGIVIGQDIWQRVFTAKDEKVSKRGTLCAGVYSILYAVATVIIGMSVFALLPHLDASQDTFVVGVSTFLPVGVRGLVLAAAVAAAMSVSSGTILASSTILYNDLYLRFVRRDRSTGKGTSTEAGSEGAGGTSSRHISDVNVTRLFAGVIGVVVMVCALWINDVLVGIDICYGYLSGCVFVPLVASFVLKRFSPRAGLWALGVSSVAVTVCFIVQGTAGSLPTLIGMGSGLAAYVIANIIDGHKIPSPLDDAQIDAEVAARNQGSQH